MLPKDYMHVCVQALEAAWPLPTLPEFRDVLRQMLLSKVMDFDTHRVNSEQLQLWRSQLQYAPHPAQLVLAAVDELLQQKHKIKLSFRI